jgi:DNA polymerase I-like protein with 3'-5' exonuclease and polymerase domains
VRGIIESTWTGAGRLTNDVKDRATRQGKLRGLDGRTLWVRSPHSALNLILQSAGIIIMKEVMRLAGPAIEAKGLTEDVDFGMVMWVHDEVQYETTPEAAEVVGQTLSELVPLAGAALNFRCPIEGNYLIGDNWSETH